MISSSSLENTVVSRKKQATDRSGQAWPEQGSTLSLIAGQWLRAACGVHTRSDEATCKVQGASKQASKGRQGIDRLGKEQAGVQTETRQVLRCACHATKSARGVVAPEKKPLISSPTDHTCTRTSMSFGRIHASRAYATSLGLHYARLTGSTVPSSLILLTILAGLPTATTRSGKS